GGGGGGRGCDVAAGARPVVDHEWLAEDLLELAAEDAREHVARAARREGDDEGHGPRGIIRRAGGHHSARQQNQREQNARRCSRHRSFCRPTNGPARPRSAPKSACSVSPWCATPPRENAPASTRWPGSSATPWLPSLLASHATPSAG